MKSFILALGLFVGGAQAAKIQVLDLPPVGFTNIYSDYRINQADGEVLVVTTLESIINTDSNFPQRKFFFTSVPGLSFDKTQNKVVLHHEGQYYECAELLESGRIFRRSRLVHKDCKLTTSKVWVNGQQRTHIYLITK